MARATLDVLELTLGGGTVTATGGTIVSADGALIRTQNTRKLFLHITAGTIAGTITIKAGDNPPAFRKNLGDVTIVLTANQVLFAAIESARHVRSDGDIYIESEGSLVVVKAYRLPDDL